MPGHPTARPSPACCAKQASAKQRLLMRRRGEATESSDRRGRAAGKAGAALRQSVRRHSQRPAMAPMPSGGGRQC
eukprot:9428313-Alexandrium_andersonii.AAC.1